MTFDPITLLGFLAGIATTGAFIPQALKTCRTRKAEDFSWAYLAIFTCGVALWFVYGMYRRDVAVAGANAITLVLLLIIGGVKLRA